MSISIELVLRRIVAVGDVLILPKGKPTGNDLFVKKCIESQGACGTSGSTLNTFYVVG